MQHSQNLVLSIALVAVAAAVAACSPPARDDSTVGQKVDAAVAGTERAAAAVAATASDINITAKVNAELAKDPALSALRVNVDTSAGRVALKGSAPSDSARSRATALAAGVEGVRSVDNQLKIESKNS